MTPALTSPNEYTPIFDWHPPRSRRGVLISCIAGSAVVHALCFYIFQIIYPPTVALIPPPARVSMITPESENGQLLLRWIEAEDPALSSMTIRPPDAATVALPKVEHVPSYVTTQPALRELPPYTPDLSIPSARPPGPVPMPRASAAPPPAVTPSSVTFADDDNHSLGTTQLPPMKFTTSSKEPPAAARFRIAIDSLGAVHYAFVQDSSGDALLDEQAREYLLQLRFPTTDHDIWTTATFEWGNDLAAPGPKTESPQP